MARVFPIYCTEVATKFYLVADDISEMDALCAGNYAGERHHIINATAHFLDAVNAALGLMADDGSRSRFVRGGSDGIWCCKLLGPAHKALLKWLPDNEFGKSLAAQRQEEAKFASDVGKLFGMPGNKQPPFDGRYMPAIVEQFGLKVAEAMLGGLGPVAAENDIFNAPSNSATSTHAVPP